MAILWVIIAAIWVVVLVGSIVGLTVPEARARAAGVAVGSTVLFLVVTAFFTWTSVDAGYVGLVKQFGAYQQSVKDAGATFHAPWQSIEQARVRNASHEIHMDNHNGGADGPAGSKESQPVFVVATFNYSLKKNCVRDLYTNYGASYFDTIIEPRVKQVFKAETVKFSAIEILPNREQIRRETAAKLSGQLAKYCVTGVDFLLKNVGFDPAFEAAIVQKQVATQQAAAEKNKVQVAIQQAQQKIETSKGTATATRIQAKADAFAARQRGKYITPELVEWERIQRWNPSIIYLPSDTIIGLPGRK